MLFSTSQEVLIWQEVQFADVGGKSQKYRTSPLLLAADTTESHEKKRFQNLLTMLKQCKDIYNHWLDKAFRVSEFKQYFIIMNLSSLKVVHSYKQIAGSWGVKVLLKDEKVRWVLWGLALITEMIIKWRNHADLQQVERCFVAANRDLYC